MVINMQLFKAMAFMVKALAGTMAIKIQLIWFAVMLMATGPDSPRTEYNAGKLACRFQIKHVSGLDN